MVKVKVGFDTEKYLAQQSEQILERVSHIDKLYLEFGGKLVGDKHAARVLPGFDEDAKMKLLETLGDQVEIIICVYAGDIESNKIRGDYGITYDREVMRLIDEYRKRHIHVNSVLLTRYREEAAARVFIKNLERRGMKVYTHSEIEGYPTHIETVLGEDGFAKNPFIETTKPVVVVTGPGAGSGKLATCMNQIFHEQNQGTDCGYAKFETFPVWNLPLKHPVNVAYEAATVELDDTNMIDNYHYDAYGEIAVNYNRDINMFPVVKRLLERITGRESVYKSPTDMGVNCIKDGIVDDDLCQEAAQQEIIRRSFAVENSYKKGLVDEDVLSRMDLLMEESGLRHEDRPAVKPARKYAEALADRFETDDLQAVMAIVLRNGKVVTGRTSELMDATSASIMNSLKELAGISDNIDLLAPMVLETILNMKKNDLHIEEATLTASELLIALAISAVTNPTAKLAYDRLDQLDKCQAHSNVILSEENENTLKRLGIDITNDPVYPSDKLFFE